jgi:hypothetical protein
MDKITLLRSTSEGFGNLARQALYWYTISPVITDADTPPNTIVHQSGSSIDRYPDAARYVSSADRTALDAGAAGYEVLQRLQTAGETNAQYRARLLAEHVLRQADWIAERRQEYASAGTGAN